MDIVTLAAAKALAGGGGGGGATVLVADENNVVPMNVEDIYAAVKAGTDIVIVFKYQGYECVTHILAQFSPVSGVYYFCVIKGASMTTINGTTGNKPSMS